MMRKNSPPANDPSKRLSIIEQERARRNALLSSIGDGVIATDERGTITEVNEASLRILGYTLKDLKGTWFPKTIKAYDEDGDLLDPMDRPVMQALFSGDPITGKAFYETKDKRHIPVSITVSPIIHDGKPLGVIEVFRDITQEYEIDRMKSEFISIASHQLRTPLTAIKTYSHMLAGGFSGKLNATQTEFMDIILGSIDRMNELINTLLDISRIEEGRLSIEPHFVNLEEVIEDIVTELGPFARAKHIDVTLQYETDDLNATTDPLLVKEVCANLLSNAIKYTPEGGSVMVNVSASTNYVTIAIEDTGYGIPSTEQARVFSKFFRAENILDKEASGTGLGLYMVKQIAESLQGSITFKSVEGIGSRFVFRLPR